MVEFLENKKMKIWLINPYGPIPGEGWRDYSFTLAGQALARAGHEVVWWTSNFSHHFKKHRSNSWESRNIAPGFELRLVPTPAYQKNIGFGRIWRDMVFSARTFIAGKRAEAPDLILYAENPLTFGFAGPTLAKHHSCHLVYDQMDLWPELIVNAFPQSLRGLVNTLFYPVYRRRRSVYKQLSGAMALAEPYLQAIFDQSPSVKSKPHTVIYNGIDVLAFRAAMSDDSVPLPLLPMKGDRTFAIFAGSLGPSYDIQTMVSAAERLANEESSLHVLIAGDGPLASLVREAAATCSNLHFLGKLAPTQLTRVYGICDIGICAYSATSNVEMPDKFYDYTAAGLAIVNSLRGEVAGKIAGQKLGSQYQPNNVDDLHAKLRALADDRESLANTRQRAWAAGGEYDAIAQYGRLPAFLEQVVAAGS